MASCLVAGGMGRSRQQDRGPERHRCASVAMYRAGAKPARRFFVNLARRRPRRTTAHPACLLTDLLLVEERIVDAGRVANDISCSATWVDLWVERPTDELVVSLVVLGRTELDTLLTLVAEDRPELHSASTFKKRACPIRRERFDRSVDVLCPALELCDTVGNQEGPSERLLIVQGHDEPDGGERRPVKRSDRSRGHSACQAQIVVGRLVRANRDSKQHLGVDLWRGRDAQEAIDLHVDPRDQLVVVEEAVERRVVIVLNPAGGDLMRACGPTKRVEQRLQLVVEVARVWRYEGLVLLPSPENEDVEFGVRSQCRVDKAHELPVTHDLNVARRQGGVVPNPPQRRVNAPQLNELIVEFHSDLVLVFGVAVPGQLASIRQGEPHTARVGEIARRPERLQCT